RHARADAGVAQAELVDDDGEPADQRGHGALTLRHRQPACGQRRTGHGKLEQRMQAAIEGDAVLTQHLLHRLALRLAQSADDHVLLRRETYLGAPGLDDAAQRTAQLTLIGVGAAAVLAVQAEESPPVAGLLPA